MRLFLLRLVAGGKPVAMNIKVLGYLEVQPDVGKAYIDNCVFANSGGDCIKISRGGSLQPNLQRKESI